MNRPERLASLDAFRGLTIAGMILVNNPGSWEHVYAPLRHAAWHGWTPTDLVFPFFLFIVGVAMAFSLPKQLERLGRAGIYAKILRRAATLFALGLLLNAFPDFDLATLRVGGVLQRIALAYLATAVVHLETGRRAQWWTTVGLLAGYWAALALVPVPGYGRGDLTPEGNLAAWIDRQLLPGRLWQGSWDPEGLLSTLPAIATTLIGLLAGYWIRSARDRAEIAAGMFTTGWGLILLGLAWDLVLPINKNLWTSSYVLFTAGAALEGLACCYWLIDVRRHRRWARPAIVFGVNALAVYVLSSLVARALHRLELPGTGGLTANRWLYEHLFLPWGEPTLASLAYATCYVAIWWVLLLPLYRRRIWLKI